MSKIDDEAPQPDPNEKVPLDKLAKVYRRMSRRIQQLTAEYEKQVEAVRLEQEQIKIAIKDQMLALGMKSVRTDEGTVLLSVKTRYSTQDWDEFKKFVMEHDALDLFEKRIAQGNMAQFLEDNPGTMPPGLNSFTEYHVSVRKPTS